MMNFRIGNSVIDSSLEKKYFERLLKIIQKKKKIGTNKNHFFTCKKKTKKNFFCFLKFGKNRLKREIFTIDQFGLKFSTCLIG